MRWLTSEDVTDWLADYELDPWGEWRDDYRMGVLAASNVNLWRGEGEEPVSPFDFIFDFSQTPEPESESQSWEEQLALVELLNIALGGQDLRT